jgi:hypothetical protein
VVKLDLPSAGLGAVSIRLLLPEQPPVSLGLFQDASRDLIVGRVFEPDGSKRDLIETDDVSLGESEQDGRVSGDDEVGVFATLIQERRKVSLVLGSKEVSIFGPPTERRAQGATKRAVLLGTMLVASFVATAARERQAAGLGDGFDERRLARAILPDEVRDGPLEGQIEVPDERETVREPFMLRDALGDDIDAF